MRKILVSETLDQIKVAVIDNSKLTNFFIDSLSLQASIRGNIYKAKNKYQEQNNYTNTKK